MKVIAYFLPQYHEVKENNEWWGEGFTEWTNIKKAQKLYRGHNQPIIPDAYYDLLEKSTVINQTEMAKKYGVYGFCYYHYWFEGKLILEKPAEQLLKWGEIQQNFCFCWANHSWRRTWNSTNELLIEQKYGDISEWKDHFEYLKPFFKDERYIKINNKPILMIYDINSIAEGKKRFDFYNEEAKKIGFDGIYLLQSINNEQEISDISNNIVLREPAISLQTYHENNFFKKLIAAYKRNKKNNFFKKPMKYSYEKSIYFGMKKIRKIILKNKNKEIFIGVFTAWDSTPRHGKHGYVIESTPKKFGEYLGKVTNIVKNNENVSEYIFLNAWNEWAEGMYLEPDFKNKHKYLEEISYLANK